MRILPIREVLVCYWFVMDGFKWFVLFGSSFAMCVRYMGGRYLVPKWDVEVRACFCFFNAVLESLKCLFRQCGDKVSWA